MPESSILITGVKGMIGYALARRLAAAGRSVVGMDRVAPPEDELGYSPKVKLGQGIAAYAAWLKGKTR